MKKKRGSKLSNIVGRDALHFSFAVPPPHFHLKMKSSTISLLERCWWGGEGGWARVEMLLLLNSTSYEIMEAERSGEREERRKKLSLIIWLTKIYFTTIWIRARSLYLQAVDLLFGMWEINTPGEYNDCAWELDDGKRGESTRLSLPAANFRRHRRLMWTLLWSWIHRAVVRGEKRLTLVTLKRFAEDELTA